MVLDMEKHLESVVFDNVRNDINVLPNINDNNEDVFADAIMDVQNNFPERLKPLGVLSQRGTLLKISIDDNDTLWKTYRGKMLEAYDSLGDIIRHFVEVCKNGHVIKLTQESYICFFPEKAKKNSTESIFQCINTICKLQMSLITNPVSIDKENIKVHFVMSYGLVFKRSIHLQKKLLYEYHGEMMDSVLNANEEVIILGNVSLCKTSVEIDNDIMQSCIEYGKKERSFHCNDGVTDLCLTCFPGK